MTKTLLALSLLLALMTGCATNTVTNLTATEAPRSPNNMYRVEYQWDSSQQTVIPTSIKPLVIVGFDQYPMKPVMKMDNRWEAWIPVPAGNNEVVYHYKVEYEFKQFGKPGKASKLSRDYKLIVK